MHQTRRLIHHDFSQLSRLAPPARRLLLSITFYNLIYPIITIFVNAFLWRISHDPSLIAINNLAWFIGIPMGFYINGILLQTFQSTRLYGAGLLVFGMLVSTLIFQPTTTYLATGIFGLLIGIFSGIHWGNRNFLTIETTTSENRIYFSGLESVSQIITGIIVPVAIGFFITFGEKFNMYSALSAYKMLAVFLLSMIGIISITALGIKRSYQKPHNLLIKNPSKLWKKIRYTQFLYGAVGMLPLFFSTIIVLYLLGNEDTLGALQSTSAVITACIIYAVARSLDTRHRNILITISFLVTLIGVSCFSLFYSTTLGIFIYLAAVSFMVPLLWIAFHSLNFDVIDREDMKNQTHYAYIADQELFLNLGRIFAIGSFLILFKLFSDTVALRFLPMFLALLHGILLLLTKNIENHLAKS